MPSSPNKVSQFEIVNSISGAISASSSILLTRDTASSLLVKANCSCQSSSLPVLPDGVGENFFSCSCHSSELSVTLSAEAVSCGVAVSFRLPFEVSAVSILLLVALLSFFSYAVNSYGERLFTSFRVSDAASACFRWWVRMLLWVYGASILL